MKTTVKREVVLKFIEDLGIDPGVVVSMSIDRSGVSIEHRPYPFEDMFEDTVESVVEITE